MDQKKIGVFLKCLRNEKGLTQEQFFDGGKIYTVLNASDLETNSKE